MSGIVQMGSIVGLLEISFPERGIAHLYDTSAGIVVENGDIVAAAHLLYGSAHLFEAGIVTIPRGHISYFSVRTLFLDIRYEQFERVSEHLQRVLVLPYLEGIVMAADYHDIISIRIHLPRLRVHRRPEVEPAVVCTVKSYTGAVLPVVVIR